MSDIYSAMEEIEQLSNTLRVVKEYLSRLELSPKELKKERQNIGLPDDYPFHGVDIKQLRTLARELHKIYKNHDYARFFKLIEALWANDHNSLEERYLAMLLLQQRRRDLNEPDVCLDTWSWMWREKTLMFIQNFSLVDMIINTVSYQIMEAWFELKEADSIVWDDLKAHASEYENKWEQCLAVMTPVKRLSKYPEWVMPTLEVVMYALRSDDEDVGRAIELALREAAKANSDLVFEYIKRFMNKSPVITTDSLRYVARYFSKSQNAELGLT